MDFRRKEINVTKEQYEKIQSFNDVFLLASYLSENILYDFEKRIDRIIADDILNNKVKLKLI